MFWQSHDDRQVMTADFIGGSNDIPALVASADLPAQTTELHAIATSDAPKAPTTSR